MQKECGQTEKGEKAKDVGEGRGDDEVAKGHDPHEHA